MYMLSKEEIKKEKKINHFYILDCIGLHENNVIKHHYPLTTYSNADQVRFFACSAFINNSVLFSSHAFICE